MEDEKIVPIDGQCGTCKFAAAFDFADSPSGPEDGVHCTSEKMAVILDSHFGSIDNQSMLKEEGYLSLWRLEVLAETTFRCECWEKKEANDANVQRDAPAAKS